MGRHGTIAAIIWVVATGFSLLFAALINPFPTIGAEEAEVVDHAFYVMTYMAAPIFGLVIAIMTYSLLRFRASGPEEDGAPIRGTGAIPKVWVLLTSALCGVLIVYPGLTGLAELRQEKTPELTVKMTAARWSWVAEYDETPVMVAGRQELVLPADRHVQFDITAVDVLHAFWVPAFRLKIDAVPGQVTTLNLTPTVEGNYEEDASYRIQCTELCGLQHAGMWMPVRVVSGEEFDAWLADKSAQAMAK